MSLERGKYHLKTGSSELLLPNTPLLVHIIYHFTHTTRHLVTSLLALLSLFRIL